MKATRNALELGRSRAEIDLSTEAHEVYLRTNHRCGGQEKQGPAGLCQSFLHNS